MVVVCPSCAQLRHWQVALIQVMGTFIGMST